MTQAQNVDYERLIRDTAAAIEAGRPVENSQRVRAAGWAVKMAVDQGNTDLLDLIILVAARRYKAAIGVLLNIVFTMFGQSSQADDPLASLINHQAADPAAAQQPTTPTQPAAAPAGNAGTTTSSRRPRGAGRPS